MHVHAAPLAPTFGSRPSGPFPIATSWTHGSHTPPPVAPPPVAPTPRRVLSIFLVLFLLGTPIAFVIGIVGTVWVATRGPRDAAHAFARAVHERRFERARRMLVDELQAEITPEAFRKSFDESQFSYGDDLRFSSVSMTGGEACLEGKVNAVAVTFRMKEVEGEWRVAAVERGHACPGTAWDG